MFHASRRFLPLFWSSFPKRCVRVSFSAGDGLGGFRFPTSALSLYQGPNPRVASDSVLFFSSSTVERPPRPNFSSLLVRFSGPLKTRCTHEYNDVHFDFFSFFFVFQGCSEV